MIDLYFWPTPNGKKVSILLEEVGLPYRVIPLDIGLGAQFSREYLALNPNHRMPAIVDHEPLGGGAPISVFESGAILMYIAEKAGRFWPQTPREKYEVAQWVMWQMANQGPKFGESGHFRRASQKPENGDLAYALRRFDDEVNRLGRRQGALRRFFEAVQRRARAARQDPLQPTRVARPRLKASRRCGVPRAPDRCVKLTVFGGSPRGLNENDIARLYRHCARARVARGRAP